MAPRTPGRWPTRTGPVLVAALLLAGATACGSDGRDGGASPAASDEPAQPVDEPAQPVDEPAPAVEPVGAVTHGSLTVDGRERTYRLYVPSGLPEGPVPLVVALHGGTGWGDQFAATNHVEGLAEANGFVVVHPDGVRQPGMRGGTWNGGVCCGIAAREEVDDVAFIDALLDEVARAHPVDPDRTFAFGHSNGGIMSYRLACELADRIVGIGAVAGTLGVEPCRPSEPVSVIHVHGAADENVPIDGGVGPRSIAGVDFPSPRDGFATLAAADGCPAASPDGTADGGVTVARREPCDDGATATFVTLAGAEHPWPGGTGRRAAAAGPDAAGPSYDATAELVAFLLAHPRP